MNKILLIIEKGTDNSLWGRVNFDDNLIVEEASSLPVLQKKIKNLLRDFHDLDPAAVDFDLAYDLTALFAEKQYLKLSWVAAKMGINRSLMAQYAAGKKHPSLERAKEIENVIHDLGRDLLEIKLALNGNSLRRSRAAVSRKKDNLKKKV
jgi:hypothetical protein